MLRNLVGNGNRCLQRTNVERDRYVDTQTSKKIFKKLAHLKDVVKNRNLTEVEAAVRMR
jgi:hypothetical protein